ncbi:histidine phosphatase family protein [Quadrisphaera sp. GCM10027208]|uniref:histidine phosphatase family protein n=1 Tax=Quadrisphaera sp. GCM10027208 TaxID=3273423 RepID=UPI00360A8005
MPTVLLVRHGRTTANADGTLAGRTPGIGLDDTGRDQARALADRMAALPLREVLSSPLERCVRTAESIVATGGTRTVPRPGLRVDERLAECDYGEWTGRSLRELAKDPMWPVVQAHPSAAVFPGGESMRAMQHRAVDAVREADARVEAEYGPDAVWVAVSHGDVIKAVLADALGAHLDAFQRVAVDPCSVSAVRYTPLRPFVLRLNDTGDLGSLVPPRRRRRRSRRESEAAVGGGAGATDRR